MTQQYNIYFDGQIAENFNKEEVKKRVQAIFHLNENKINILFNGTAHVLKENLTKEECREYLQKLLDIGLIAKADPVINPTNIGDNSENQMDNKSTQITVDNSVKTKKSSQKILPIFILVIIVIAALFYAWHTKLIELPFLNNKSTKVIEKQTVTNTTEKSSTEPEVNKVLPEAIIEDKHSAPTIIEECTNQNVTTLLGKVLAEGIPKLIHQTSSEINLTIKDYTDNQELYFNPTTNKRLCSVTAEFSVSSPTISTEISNPFVTYEIIYEIEKNSDQSIKLSTFRQKILSTNIKG